MIGRHRWNCSPVYWDPSHLLPSGVFSLSLLRLVTRVPRADGAGVRVAAADGAVIVALRTGRVGLLMQSYIGATRRRIALGRRAVRV
jgi:hypothetical protein